MKTHPIAVMLTVVTAVPQIACAGGPAADEAEDLAAIASTRQQEIAAAHSSNAAAFSGLMTDDVVFMPPNQPAITGRAALEPWLAAFWESFRIEGLEYPSVDVTIVGDYAIERWTFNWDLVPVAGGEPIHDRGKGMHIYRRQPDGSWKIAVDIWNSDLAPSN